MLKFAQCSARLLIATYTFIELKMSPKRTYDDMKDQTTALSPFMPMFEVFRAELDEHHARREKVIKASRDITAASKKM